jgi:hypothetical protein
MNPSQLWQVGTPTGKTLGPFSDQQIVQLTKDGKITRSHKLLHPERTKGEWVSAGKITALQKFFVQKASEGSVPSTPQPPSLEPSIDAQSFFSSDLSDWADLPAPTVVTNQHSSDYWTAAGGFASASQQAGGDKSTASKPSSKKELSTTEKYLQGLESEQRSAEENSKKESSSNLRIQIIAASVIIVLGVFGSYGAYVWSKPLKMRWAADNAFSEMINATAVAEAMSNSRLKSSEPFKESATESYMWAKAEMAAAKLQSILDQMPPDLRADWQEGKIISALERASRRGK